MNYKENITKERVLAVIIDVLIIIGITFVLNLIVGTLLGVEVLANNNGLTSADNYTLYLILSTIISLIVIVVYQGYLPSVSNGQTLGKKHFKIKLINQSNENPTFIVHTFRNILWWGVYLSFVLLPLYFINSNLYNIIEQLFGYVLFGAILISLVAYLVNPSEGALHDKLFKTRVVDENYQFGLKTEELSEIKEDL